MAARPDPRGNRGAQPPHEQRGPVLSCLAQFNRYVTSDPRKNLVDLVSNPLNE
ncbi:hypothetical protein [Streptomyces sioyaensis]|uniref:hypothetical protein n=1 Tax=Streptomyces sioyaensis TaxID=67364 RepID=UPI0037A4D465